MSVRPSIAIPFTVLLAVACPAVQAQTARRDDVPVRPIALTSEGTEIGTEYNYYGETIKRTNGGRIRYSNNYFQEYVQGRVEGYVYHPRFVSFQTQLKLGLSQQRLRRENGGVETSDSNDELLGYDLRADILRDHPVSATVAATREERMLMGLFVDRYQVKTESQRGTLRWTTRDMQMDATGSHTETEEFGAVSQSKTVSDMFAYGLHHQVGRRMRTDLRYTLQEYNRDFRAETSAGDVENESDLQTQLLDVNNRLDLTADKRASLWSNVRVHRQRNNTDLDTYFWQERLELKPTDNLRTYLMGSALRNDYTDNKIDTYRGEAGIDHELFKSLKSHLDLHGRRTDYGAVTEDRYGATARVNYRKTNPLGVFSAGYSRTLDVVDRSGGTATNGIIDESHVVTYATPTFLDNADVVDSSLVVTDGANQIVYTEGFDYEIVKQGRRTGIRALPGGLLPDNSTVLIDYRLEIDGSLKYLADDEDIHARQDFHKYLKGLSVYAQRHAMRTHRVESELDPQLLEYVDQSVGARQEWRAYALSSEYQEYRDDLGGYDQWRNQVEGNHGISRRLRWGWNAGVTTTDHITKDDKDLNDHSRYYYAGTNLNGTFARNGYWKVEARSMRETGRVDQTIHGIIARLGFDWRRLTVEGGARFEEYDVYESDRQRVQLFTSLKWRLTRSSRRGGARS